MGFRTHKFYNPQNTFLLAEQQHLYNSPYEAMKAMADLGSSFGAEDPGYTLTGSIKEFYQKQKMTADEDWMSEEEKAAKRMSAEEANEKYRPPNPYTHDVRKDVAEFEHQARKRNEKQKNILANVGPEMMGSTALPMLGAIAGGLTDPVSLTIDLFTGGLGAVARGGVLGLKAARVAKILGYGSKVGSVTMGTTARTLGRNFVENLTPELLLEMRNYQAGENFHLDDFITNLTAGAIAGSIIETGIDFGKQIVVRPEVEPPPIPEQPTRETGVPPTIEEPPPIPEDTNFKYNTVDELVRTNVLTNDYLVDGGFKPVDMMLDYNHQTTQGLRDHIGNRHNRLGRDYNLEKRLSDEYAKALPKFTPDGIRQLGKNPVDWYAPYFDSLTKKMDNISQRLEAAEKAEVARVEKAKTEAPTDEGYEKRIKDFKYRNKIADFYDNMGGDINEMRNLQEALFAQGKDLTPAMKKYLNEVEDAIRMFGKRTHKKLTKKPLDKVSIYNEAYDDLANSHLSEWGFDTKYKSVAEEAAEQGARVTTGVDLDRLPGELDRELSPQEILEKVQEAMEGDVELAEEVNTMREAHATRMKDLDAAHKELVDSLRKEKYIDDIVELMEQAELEADPAIRAELKETIEEYQEAMKDAMAPEEFRDVMDSLYDCIRG